MTDQFLFKIFYKKILNKNYWEKWQSHEMINHLVFVPKTVPNISVSILLLILTSNIYL
jgi:hypothetical protein